MAIRSTKQPLITYSRFYPGILTCSCHTAPCNSEELRKKKNVADFLMIVRDVILVTIVVVVSNHMKVAPAFGASFYS